MNKNLTTNDAGLDLVKEFEGFRSRAYVCPAGKLTYGYGHTSGVTPYSEITEHDALILLKKDLSYFEDKVRRCVEVELNSNQFSALVSFTYNLGEDSLYKSTLLTKLNKKDYEGAANEFSKWVYAVGKILPGLVKRREKEKQLFLKRC